MKNIILTITIALLPVFSMGQVDSLQHEILNYDDKKQEIISNGRRLLLDSFLEDDFEKVEEVKNYLVGEVENEDYAVFYPAEYWFILYWTGEYQELLKSINQFDSVTVISFQYKIKPDNDLLYNKLLVKTSQMKDFLISQLQKSMVAEVDKDFLIMNLSYLLAGKNDPDITQDMLNDMADEFLGNHPNSEYEDYTRKNIRFRQVASKWGFGFEFFSGYGIFTDKLSEEYKNNIPIGVAFDICYKDFTLFLRDYIGFSKNNNDWDYGTGVWEEGSQVRIFLPEASLGYTLFENNHLKITPFAGVATTNIGPTEFDKDEEPDLEKVELDFTGTYTMGLNLDIKLGRSKIPMVSYNKPEDSYWFLRLRYSYNNMGFDKKYDGFNGNMHYLTIGIGGLGRAIKRDY